MDVHTYSAKYSMPALFDAGLLCACRCAVLGSERETVCGVERSEECKSTSGAFGEKGAYSSPPDTESGARFACRSSIFAARYSASRPTPANRPEPQV